MSARKCYHPNIADLKCGGWGHDSAAGARGSQTLAMQWSSGDDNDDDDVSNGVTCPVHGEECPHSGCSHCLGGPCLLSLLLQGKDLD